MAEPADFIHAGGSGKRIRPIQFTTFWTAPTTVSNARLMPSMIDFTALSGPLAALLMACQTTLAAALSVLNVRLMPDTAVVTTFLMEFHTR